METINTKIQKACCLLALALLCSLVLSSDSAPDCCRLRTCSCRVFDILSGSGNHAAGILTLGKRKSSAQNLQTRLQRLLQGSGNQAAGILTMGKRGQDGGESRCLTPGVLVSDTPSPFNLCPTSNDPANVSKGPSCQQDPNM
ncbi:hypocretin neuropeptide precursor [Discoglossus pictus]